MLIDYLNKVLKYTIILVVFSYIQNVSSTITSQERSKPKGPYIAYSMDKTIDILNIDGSELRKINFNESIDSFTVSNDLSKIIYATKGQQGYGGALYLYDLRNGKTSRLLHGVRITPRKDNEEVYSDPDFSNDGNTFVFSVRLLPAHDAVESAGLFAIMNLRTNISRKLLLHGSKPGTLWPYMFPIDSHWSPDNKRIVLNYGNFSEIVSFDGSKKYSFPNLPRDWEWSTTLGWYGNRCLIMQGGEGPDDGIKNPAVVVNLLKRTFASLSAVLHVPVDETTNLIAANGTILVQHVGNHLVVYRSGLHWNILKFDKESTMNIVRVGLDPSVDLACR